MPYRPDGLGIRDGRRDRIAVQEDRWTLRWDDGDPEAPETEPRSRRRANVVRARLLTTARRWRNTVGAPLDQKIAGRAPDVATPAPALLVHQGRKTTLGRSLHHPRRSKPGGMAGVVSGIRTASASLSFEIHSTTMSLSRLGDSSNLTTGTNRRTGGYCRWSRRTRNVRRRRASRQRTMRPVTMPIVRSVADRRSLG